MAWVGGPDCRGTAARLGVFSAVGLRTTVAHAALSDDEAVGQAPSAAVDAACFGAELLRGDRSPVQRHGQPDPGGFTGPGLGI